MSVSNAVPEGLKNQEREKGNHKKRPPIPYIPIVDEYSYKIKLPDKTEFSVPIWDTGTQEAFLIHAQQAKSTCKRKGLFKEYDEDALQVESSQEYPKGHRKCKEKGSRQAQPVIAR
jgi:hypothetical protein